MPPSRPQPRAAHRRVGQQHRGHQPVVGGAQHEPVGPVGHQPPDRPEVAGRRVPPGHHHLDLAGHLLDLLEDVGAEQHGAALGAHGAQQLHQVDPLPRVHAVERLVEEQHRGVVHQRGGHLDPLPHPLAVRRDGAVLGLGHLDLRDRPLGGRAGVREPVQLGARDHELAAGQVVEHRLPLRHQAELAVDLLVAPQRLAVQGDRPGRGGEEARHQRDQRGLAGAVRAEQPGHARADGHRDVVDRDDVAVPARHVVDARCELMAAPLR